MRYRSSEKDVKPRTLRQKLQLNPAQGADKHSPGAPDTLCSLRVPLLLGLQSGPSGLDLTAEPDLDTGMHVEGRWAHPEGVLKVIASMITISGKYRLIKAQINRQVERQGSTSAF